MLFTFQASKLKYIISESKNIPLSIVFPYRLTIDLPEAVLGSMCMVLGTIKKWFSFPTAAECARSFMKKKKKIVYLYHVLNSISVHWTQEKCVS